MKRKKLLKQLAAMLSTTGSTKKAQLESLRDLLEKLEKKEVKLEKKLAAAEELGDEGAEDRERFADKLKVLRVQRAKGQRRCEELED